MAVFFTKANFPLRPRGLWEPHNLLCATFLAELGRLGVDGGGMGGDHGGCSGEQRVMG